MIVGAIYSILFVIAIALWLQQPYTFDGHVNNWRISLAEVSAVCMLVAAGAHWQFAVAMGILFATIVLVAAVYAYDRSVGTVIWTLGLSIGYGYIVAGFLMQSLMASFDYTACIVIIVCLLCTYTKRGSYILRKFAEITREGPYVSK